MLPATTLSSRWRTHAKLFRDHAEEPLARAYEACATELEEALASEGDVALTLRQAAEESGYSADHLGRLLREGTIPNAGRPRAPRIARGHLPMKSGVASGPANLQLDRTQIVRSAIDEGAA